MKRKRAAKFAGILYEKWPLFEGRSWPGADVLWQSGWGCRTIVFGSDMGE